MKMKKIIAMMFVSLFAIVSVASAGGNGDGACITITGDKQVPCEVYLGCPPPADQNDDVYCPAEEPQNAIMNVCCCAEDFFTSTTEVAIKYKIVKKDGDYQGVYFTRFEDALVNVTPAERAANLAPNNQVLGQIWPAILGQDVCDAPPTTTCGQIQDDQITWNMVPDDDTLNNEFLAADNGMFDWDGFVYRNEGLLAAGMASLTIGVPFDSDGQTCTLNPDDKIVEMWTVETAPVAGGIAKQDFSRDAGYQVDVNALQSCFWVFNLPNVIMDWTEAVNHQNETVQAEIQLIVLPDDGDSICADATEFCSCIVDLAVICDNDTETLGFGMRKMYFPYVTNAPHSSWATGIAISNLDTHDGLDGGAREIQFIYVDNAGTVFSHLVAGVDTQVYQFVFETFVTDVAGWEGVAEGPGVLQVLTNFAADGYQFNTDGKFGAGVLPRVLFGVFKGLNWNHTEVDDWDDMVPFNF